MDPITAYQQPITNFCRYCYARNNPYRFNDPDGRNGVAALGGLVVESWKALNGQGFDGDMVAGALVDGYNGEGDGLGSALFGDVSAVATLAGGLGVGRAIGSLVARRGAAEGVSLARANKIHHIFSQSRHNLGGLSKAMGGETKAFKAIEKATTKAVDVSKSGKFETTIKVGGEQVTVRGNVVDGEIKIGTAFIREVKDALQ